MCLSPDLRISPIFSEVASNSVPPRSAPTSASLESKSSSGMAFLDLPLTIKILSLLIAGLDPLKESKNPITCPAIS